MPLGIRMRGNKFDGPEPCTLITRMFFQRISLERDFTVANTVFPKAWRLSFR